MLISVTYWSETAGSSLPCKVVRVMDSTLTSLPDHKWITDGASLIGSPPCTVQITQLDRIMATRPRDIDLTRHKISDGWRERAWLQVRGCSYHKLGIGAASRSLHRL